MEDIILRRKEKLNEEINVAKSQLKTNLSNVDPVEYAKSTFFEVKKKQPIASLFDKAIKLNSHSGRRFKISQSESFLTRLYSFLTR